MASGKVYFEVLIPKSTEVNSLNDIHITYQTKLINYFNENYTYHTYQNNVQLQVNATGDRQYTDLDNEAGYSQKQAAA